MLCLRGAVWLPYVLSFVAYQWAGKALHALLVKTL